jgi:hypothetical protein
MRITFTPSSYLSSKERHGLRKKEKKSKSSFVQKKRKRKKVAMLSKKS